MKSQYLAIAGRIRRELQDIAVVVERSLSIWQEGTAGSSTSNLNYYIDATALNLHSFYSGIERLLEIIVDGIDQTRPSGSNWHQAILQQLASEIPGVRPPILRAVTREQLDRYRGFRHVVRNIYTFTLDPEQIEILIKHLQPTMQLVSQDLLDFSDLLEKTASD
ncbi:hypothetical protein OOK60_04320 [Trichothermofontia sichuanensis B231]|uniref:ribonuclease toxin HepT-like protein n=1 Tax=Trichothermofontia sichuanensis TaxID=3045816 RepID=UPI0022474056|nr:hypothetical protein [Trichothermofontia sichuanensis]UZQ55307.1 hypothetical protein OOK60_04320 [Trichothermofontia sichuanensis B231]